MLSGAEAAREPDDGDLERALDELLSARAELTRKLLVGGGAAEGPPQPQGPFVGFVSGY